MKLALEKGKSRTLRLRGSLKARTRRSGSSYGRGRNSTALVTLKSAVLAPTPKAMVSAAVSAKIGLFRSVRPANPSSRRAILQPHSRAAAALRIVPRLPPIGFESLRQRLLTQTHSDWPHYGLAATRRNPGFAIHLCAGSDDSGRVSANRQLSGFHGGISPSMS